MKICIFLPLDGTEYKEIFLPEATMDRYALHLHSTLYPMFFL